MPNILGNSYNDVTVLYSWQVCTFRRSRSLAFCMFGDLSKIICPLLIDLFFKNNIFFQEKKIEIPSECQTVAWMWVQTTCKDNQQNILAGKMLNFLNNTENVVVL